MKPFFIKVPASIKYPVINKAKQLGFDEPIGNRDYEYLLLETDKSCGFFEDTKYHTAELKTLDFFFDLKPELKFDPKVGEYYKHESGGIYLLSAGANKYKLINLNGRGQWTGDRSSAIEAFHGVEKEFKKVEIKWVESPNELIKAAEKLVRDSIHFPCRTIGYNKIAIIKELREWSRGLKHEERVEAFGTTCADSGDYQPFGLAFSKEFVEKMVG